MRTTPKKYLNCTQFSTENVPGVTSDVQLPSISSVTDGNASVEWHDRFKDFLDAYKQYYEQSYMAKPIGLIDRSSVSDAAKRRLKLVSRALADNIQHCDTPSAIALMFCMRNISKRCKLVELYAGTLLHLLRELRSGEDESSNVGIVKFLDIGNCIDVSQLEQLHRRDLLAAFLLGTLRAFDLKNPPNDVVDELFALVNSNIYQWKTSHLVNICRDLAWVCRFCETERFSGLLRRCISLVCEGIGKTGETLSRAQLITLHKAASVTKGESTSFAPRMNHLILSLVRSEANSVPSDLSERMNLLYRRTKGNIHLLNVMLVSGMPVDAGVVRVLLEGVMNFCLEYFTATSNVWQLKQQMPVTHDYNEIDPRVSHLLYAKYPNKIFRAPGSLDPEKPKQKTVAKLEERYRAVVVSLSRLLMNKKVAFCRGLKLCELRLRLFNRQIYKELDDNIHMFMNTVSNFRFEEPQLVIQSDLRRALRHLGYKSIPMMVDGTFPLNCIDYERRLYCELCNAKEARLSKNGEYIYNKAMELKLRYLDIAGWRGAMVLESEWRCMPADTQIALLRRKLEPFN